MWSLDLIIDEKKVRTYKAETWNEINTIFCCLMKIDPHAEEKAEYRIYENEKSAPQMLGDTDGADWVGDQPFKGDYSKGATE